MVKSKIQLLQEPHIIMAPFSCSPLGFILGYCDLCPVSSVKMLSLPSLFQKFV
jgi:hypothetical protein